MKDIAGFILFFSVFQVLHNRFDWKQTEYTVVIVMFFSQ